MAQVLAIATDFPPHRLDQELTRRLLVQLLRRWNRPPERFLSILRNSMIDMRHAVYDEHEIIEEHSLCERNNRYRAVCIELAERTARQALRQARLKPRDIDALITVSCTGFMLPSLDAYLIDRLDMKPNTRRLPITELGCSAGAAGLTRAWEQVRAYPGSRTLLVSVELPTLTFQPHDQRLCQIISNLIFGDGAAAVVVGPEESPSPHAPLPLGKRGEGVWGERGPVLLGGRTYTMPGTLGEMGYELDETGFHIILSSAIPQHIKNSLRSEVNALAAEHGVRVCDIRWCAMHPAGPKVLRFVEEEFCFENDELASAWTVLRDHGNMSSAAVLFVLAELMRRPPPGGLGLIAAFGPGVSGELLLARWGD